MARSLEKTPKIDLKFISSLHGNLDAVLGKLLRAVHGGIGLLDQSLRGQRVLWAVGDPQADREMNAQILRDKLVVLYLFADSFRDDQSAVQRRLRQHDHKLVPAVSSHH